MAITSANDSVDALWNARQAFLIQKSLVTFTTGQMTSMWAAGYYPFAGAAPTSAAVCTGALAGAIAFSAPAGGKNTYIMMLEQYSPNTGSFCSGGVYDRIIHSGGLSGTSTSVQTINTPAVPSDRGVAANFSDLEWYLEWYSATGSSTPNITVNYTNQSNASKSTTFALTASIPANSMKWIVPLAGDYIQSIQSIQLSGTTGTAGNFGITCANRAAPIYNANAGTRYFQDYACLGLPRVYDNACLFLAIKPVTNAQWIISMILGQK